MRSSHVHALHHGAQKEDTRRPCHSRQHNSGVQPRRGMRRRGRRRARCARGAVRATPDTRQAAVPAGRSDGITELAAVVRFVPVVKLTPPSFDIEVTPRLLSGSSSTPWSPPFLLEPSRDRARSRRSARSRSQTARSRLLARPRSRMARRPPFTRPSRTAQRPLPLASLRFAVCPPDPRSHSQLLALPSPGHRAFCQAPAIGIPPQLGLGQPAPPRPPSQASLL